MTKYLLPCQCGQLISVDASQSGLTQTCRCGAVVVVPTLRGLQKLPKVESAPPPERTWGPKQGMIFLGSLIGLVGAVLGGLLLVNPIVDPRENPPRARISPDVQPADTLALWEQIRSQGLQEDTGEIMDAYQSALRFHRFLLGGASTLAVIGVLLIGGSFFVRSPADRRRAPARQRAGS
jgi:hypothetical protein